MEIRTGESALRIDPSMPSYIDISTLFDFFFYLHIYAVEKARFQGEYAGRDFNARRWSWIWSSHFSRKIFAAAIFLLSYIYDIVSTMDMYFFLFIINKSLIFIWIR